MASWRDAFIGGGGKKPLSQEEIERRMAFKEAFGSEPPVTEVRGGREKIDKYTARNRYLQTQDDFVAVIPLEELGMQERDIDRLVESTGGILVAWKTRTGTKYLALLRLLGCLDQYRIPDFFFSNPNYNADAPARVWQSVLGKGAVLNLPPDDPNDPSAWGRISPSIRAKNEENKKALEQAA